MEIFLKDYAHLNEDGDWTLALLTALKDAKKEKNPVLHLGGGVLNFYKKNTVQKFYYISNNTYGVKNIVFPLIGFDGLTVDGDGAELLFHGTVLPFVIDSSKNITLKNFSVDYPHPFFFQAEITDSGENFADLKYDNGLLNVDVDENGKLVFSCEEENWKFVKDNVLACEFERDTKAPSAYIPPYIISLKKEKTTSFLGEMYRYLSAEKTGENSLRLSGEFRFCHNKGNMFVCTFPGRENPGIFGNESESILIENVTLYATGAMGVICQLCENVTLNGVKAAAKEGRYLSVNADATHFVNCSGAVKLTNCVFLNMLDDAGNVHGNYHKIVKKLDSHTYLLAFGHHEQAGVNIYRAGDRIHVTDNKTLQPIGEYTVKSSFLISKNYIMLELNEEAPDINEGFACENFSRMPELYINGCISGFNRPRGFLPGTWRKTVIENCTFFNMSCALHFTGDCNDWFESGPVNDVIIRNNNFANSAYTGYVVISINPHVLEGDKPYHRNITIENNVFRLHEKRFVYASHVENLKFKNNKFICDSSLPAHEPCGVNGMIIEKSCVNAEISEAEE